MSVEDGSRLPYQMPLPPENFRYLEKSQGREEEGEGIYSQEASTTTMEWSSVSTWLHVKGRLGAASKVPQVLEMDISVLFVFFNSNLLFIYLFIFIFSFGCVGSSFLCEGFLQLRRAGATLHRGARASHYRGLSCCGAQAPVAQAQ